MAPRLRRSNRRRLTLENLERRLAPATFTVLNANDAGAGSLRQAILDANAVGGADDIAFDAGFFATPRTITLTAASGQLAISDDLIVNGPGAGLLTVSGGGVTRVFTVASSSQIVTATLNGLTVSGGNGAGPGQFNGYGGGILVGSAMNLTLNDAVVTGNLATSAGGGIGVAHFGGFVTVRDSTISGNSAGSNGGGLYFFFNGSLLMENSTVSGNVNGGTGGGGGLSFDGTVTADGFTIRNSTFANNTVASNGGGICLRGFVGTAVIQNSTITGNSAGNTGTIAGQGGGGIAVFGTANSIVSIDSCIISGNSATNGRSDLAKSTAVVLNLNKSAVGDPDGYVPSSGAGNLPAGAALNLYPLAAYGGMTQTVALGVGSAALNAGSNVGGLATDQRGAGFPRVVGAAADIGAFEGTVDIPRPSGGPYAPVTAGGGATYTFDVTYSGTTPIDVSTLDDNDVRVTGPGGFSQLATFVSVTPSGNGTPRTATYRITAPGGTFGGEDNGTYTITVLAGQVANTVGGTTVATTVGTFSVNIPLTLTVTNLNDAGAGSLRQAILDANAAAGTADTIVFQAGLTGTITLTEASGQLNVTDSLTIAGPGAGLLTISGGGVVRQFNISDNGAATAIVVNLSGLTLTAGAARPGAGISGQGDGGAIVNANETVVLDGVVISGNATSGNGDGGGMATLSTGAVTVRNSTIANNTALGSGGGIGFRATGASLLMENSTVSGNTAGSVGGGIFFVGTPGAGGFTVRNTTIAGNAATSTFGSGGGVGFVLASGILLFQNCTITNNSSANNSTIVGSGGGGIAVFSGAPVLTLDSTIVSGNTVNAANPNSDIATVAATVTNANFSAIGDPDGFTLSGASGNNLPFGTALNLMPLGNNGGPTATIGLFLGSPAVNAGRNTAGLTTDQRGAGFPRVVGAAADIGAFEGAIDAPSASGGPYATVSTGGGATYTFDVTYSGVTAINVSTLDNNDVRVTGPGGFNQPATFVSVNPAGNGTPRTATYRITAPGGTFGGEDNGTYTITVQAGQVANINGGTVPNTVVGTFVVGIPQTYTVTTLANSGAGSLRQAILDANASVNVPDTIVFQSGLTGTITLNAPAGSGELLITEDLTITGPGAAALTVRGSGIGRVFTIINATRAITVGISGLTITGGFVGMNQPGTNYSFDGGGIYMADEIVTLDGVVLVGNSCSADFGGDGGGIATSPNGNLTIRNSTVSGNSGNEGGGIYIGEGGSLLMVNSTVSGNTAHPTNDGFAFGGDGGGIFLYNRGSLVFENCTVSGNTALGEMGGGGIYSYASAGMSSVTVRNSTIAGNTAQHGGGITLFGLPGSNPVLLIQNSTITGNSAVTTSTTPGHGGGGIAVPANAALTPSISVVSSILSGNTATAANGRGDIAMPNSIGVNVNFSAIGDADGYTQSGSSGNNLPVGATLGLGTLAFNGGPTQTVSFAANSPLRNAGSNPANLTTDQRGAGFVRVEGPAADIGAFEFQTAAPPQVSSTIVNGGQANLTQRSRVISLTVTFDTIVNFESNVGQAFTLIRNGGKPVSFKASASNATGVTVVTLNDFTGASTQFGSLADGRYTLTALASHITDNQGQALDGDGNGQPGGNYTFGDAQGLFRFFGDVNGDRRIDGLDFGAFVSTFNLPPSNPNFLWFFDINGDGRVDGFDFGQFAFRYNTMLP